MTALASAVGSGRKEHMKLGCSQSIFPNGMLSCGQRWVAEAIESSGAARPAHQIPTVKRDRRLKAVNFFNGRCTKAIIALCSPKVNPQGFKPLPVFLFRNISTAASAAPIPAIRPLFKHGQALLRLQLDKIFTAASAAWISTAAHIVTSFLFDLKQV